MKKLIILFTTIILSFSFISCGDDEEEVQETLEFLQIRVYSEEDTAPYGRAYLFYVEDYIDYLDSTEPNLNYPYMPVIFYHKYGEFHVMTPISEYGEKYDGFFGTNDKLGHSRYTFYWDRLSTIYGIPKPGGKYVLLVQATANTFNYKFYIELSPTKNTLVEIHLPTKDETIYESGWVTNADIKICDYPGDY